MTVPKVLGRTSSINVRKVLWTLDELGLAYEREDWGAGFASTKDPKFLAMNPNALVPVLIDEHGPLWESNTICRYLATGAPLLPEGRRAHAIVEQWMDWQATELNLAWRYAFAGLVRWLHSPIERLEWPALTAYYDRLKQRPAFAAWSLPEVP